MQDAAHSTHGDAAGLFENKAALTCRPVFSRSGIEEWIDAGQPLCMHLPFILGFLGQILGRQHGRCMLNMLLRQLEPSETTQTCPSSPVLRSMQASLGLAVGSSSFLPISLPTVVASTV